MNRAKMIQLVDERLGNSVDAALRLLGDENVMGFCADVATALLATTAKHGRIAICGNGGSCAMADHFVGELVGRFDQRRPPLPAISLSAGAAITCIGNDFGFESIYSRQVCGLLGEKDLLIVLTTSSTSRDVENAVAAAHDVGAQTIGFRGRLAEAWSLCGREYFFVGPSTAVIQEMHLMAIHAICALVDKESM